MNHTDSSRFFRRQTDAFTTFHRQSAAVAACIRCGAENKKFAMKTIRTPDGMRHICKGC